jgi:hypothetical protein
MYTEVAVVPMHDCKNVLTSPQREEERLGGNADRRDSLLKTSAINCVWGLRLLQYLQRSWEPRRCGLAMALEHINMQ